MHNTQNPTTRSLEPIVVADALAVVPLTELLTPAEPSKIAPLVAPPLHSSQPLPMLLTLAELNTWMVSLLLVFARAY
ncbi:MAG TPA: hypothetical protein VEH30_05895 [Terriglobales bacterium]|nr:hypothetical protein [Terriglobales bacterium]